MEWLDYMNASLDYIEENLSIKKDYEKIAAKALCSSYNYRYQWDIWLRARRRT